jgi:hypothetical protein
MEARRGRNAMATYILVNEHPAEKCEEIFQEYEANKDRLPAEVKGKDDLCTCPGGVHAGWVAVEADSEQAALDLMSVLPINQSYTRAIEGTVVQL